MKLGSSQVSELAPAASRDCTRNDSARPRATSQGQRSCVAGRSIKGRRGRSPRTWAVTITHAPLAVSIAGHGLARRDPGLHRRETISASLVAREVVVGDEALQVLDPLR